MRAVVGRHIALESVINLLEGDVVDIAYRDGCQHVIQIVGTNEMRLDGKPFAHVTSISVLLAPTELEEWCTRDDLATNEDILSVALTIIIDVRLSYSLTSHL